MPNKITQFQIDFEQLSEYGIDIAADWVFDPDSELYKKYRHLRKSDFIKLMETSGDEIIKRQIFPIGAALFDNGNSSYLAPMVLYNNEIIPVDDILGYIGVNCTRDQIVDAVMDFLK